MWDQVIKGVSMFVAVRTLAISAGVYLSQRQSKIKVFDRQSKVILLTKQSEVYFEAVSIVSKFAIKDSCEWEQKDLDRFWQLYWGELHMVGDRKVSTEINTIANIMKDGGIGHDVPTLCDTPVDIAKNSLTLADSVRKSIERSWGVEIGNEIGSD